MNVDDRTFNLVKWFQRASQGALTIHHNAITINVTEEIQECTPFAFNVYVKCLVYARTHQYTCSTSIETCTYCPKRTYTHTRARERRTMYVHTAY